MQRSTRKLPLSAKLGKEPLPPRKIADCPDLSKPKRHVQLQRGRALLKTVIEFHERLGGAKLRSHIPNAEDPTSLLTKRNQPTSFTMKTPRKLVRWGDVTIREHKSILGDHPGVSTGAPLTLDWRCQRETTFDVIEYEYTVRRCSPRRPRKELVLSGPARDT